MPLKWPHIQINHDRGKKKLLLRRLPLIITEKFESRGIFEELDKLENVKNHKKSYLIRGCIITIKKCICTVLYDLFPVWRISLYRLCIVPLLTSSTLNRLYPDSRSSSDVQGTNTCYNKSINTYSNHSTAVQILMASQNKLARIIHFFF